MRRLREYWLAFLTLALIVSLVPEGVAAAKSDSVMVHGEADALHVKLIGRYTSGAGVEEGGTEIVAYDAKSQTMFSVNGAEEALDVIQLSGLQSGTEAQVLTLHKRVKLTDIHKDLVNISDLTSVAISPTGQSIAIAIPAEPEQDNGYVVFLDLEGNYITHVEVGALPDMLTFTPDGKKVLVANEGQPDDDYVVNPEGSVAIIDVTGMGEGLKQADVTMARFDDTLVNESIRRVNPDFTIAQDMEPEYIVVSADSRKAFVILQENNSVAILDIASGSFESITSFGYKDWSHGNNKLDASDKDDRIHIRNWPVLGLYQPDGASLYETRGKTYLLTANEGDAADYDGFSEEARVEDLVEQYALHAERFAGYTQDQIDELIANGLFDKEQLGRLKTTTAAPKNADGKYEAIYGFGARSFSIWDTEDMSLVYDSGGEFETILAEALPEFFNTNHADNEFDTRSDDKGPEPESVIVGSVGGASYAFVGLERSGGIMIYNITNPASAKFVKYITSRDFGKAELSGDSAPEGLVFVPAADSPTGEALLLAAHEVTGTIAVYELAEEVYESEENDSVHISIMHVNDIHARVESGIGYAKMSALVEQQRSLNPNTLFVDAGDTLHGQTIATLVQGESIVRLLNEMGLDVLTAGNHDFNYGLERLLELKKLAKFPILGANVTYKDSGKPVLESHVIKQFDGVKVGIFGLATPETAYKTHPNNVRDITFTDPVAAARQQVEQLQGKVDVIIALAHLGMDGSSTDTSAKVAEQVDGIDLIIDGHSHQEMNTFIHDTLIVQTGEYANNIGIVDLEVKDGKVVALEGRLISEAETENVMGDANIQAVIDTIKNEQNKVLDEVVAHSSVVLDGERAIVRTQESNLGNLITDAMLYVTGADVAMTNGGGIRASIEAGDMTKGDIITVLPFGNYVVTMDVTGAEIVAALQHGAGDYPDAKGAFPQVAGISFAIDESKPKGEKVHTVLVNGRAIEPGRTYSLATNDFLAVGGDEYVMFEGQAITGHYQALDEALIAYMESIGAVEAKTEGRIVVKREGGSEAAKQAHIYVVQPGDNLYRIGLQFGIHWKTISQFNKLQDPSLIYPKQQISIPAN